MNQHDYAPARALRTILSTDFVQKSGKLPSEPLKPARLHLCSFFERKDFSFLNQGVYRSVLVLPTILSTVYVQNRRCREAGGLTALPTFCA